MTKTEICSILEKAREKTGLSESKFSKEYQLPYTTIRGIEQGLNFTIDSFLKYADLLGFNVDLIKQGEKQKAKANKKPKYFASAYDLSETQLGKAIEAFEDYRRETKKSFKNQRQFDIWLKKLDQIADSDEDKIQVIANSIANGWQGIFPTNNKINQTTTENEADKFARKIQSTHTRSAHN